MRGLFLILALSGCISIGNPAIINIPIDNKEGTIICSNKWNCENISEKIAGVCKSDKFRVTRTESKIVSSKDKDGNPIETIYRIIYFVCNGVDR